MSDSFKPPETTVGTTTDSNAATEDSTQVTWFDSKSSRKQSAILYFHGKDIRAITTDGERRDGNFETVEISSRLGNVPRTLTFIDGVVLSIPDNDFIDRMLATQSARAKISLLHYLESHWRHVVMFFATTILFLFTTVAYGIPAAADFVAHRIDADRLTAIDDNIYKQMQKQNFLRESKLPHSTIARVQKLFSQITINNKDNTNYQLHTHDVVFASTSVANAFALPGGKVIITDKLITLLEDDEITAVLAHEVGHVELRHGMRSVLSAAGVLVFFTAINGDISWIISGGSALLNLQYSRDNEREADCFAYHYLQQHNLSPDLLGQSLQKMEQSFALDNDEGDLNGDLEVSEDEATFWRAVTKALSTHPHTEERQDLAKACQ